jgi:hypothetical protein
MRSSFSKVALVKEFFSPEKTLLQFKDELQSLIRDSSLDELADMVAEEWGMQKVYLKNDMPSAYGDDTLVVYIGTPNKE